MLVLNAGRVKNYEENQCVMKAPAVGLSIGWKRIVFKNKSSKALRRAYDFVNTHYVDIFNILVPLYKEHFSEYCKKD